MYLHKNPMAEPPKIDMVILNTYFINNRSYSKYFCYLCTRKRLGCKLCNPLKKREMKNNVLILWLLLFGAAWGPMPLHAQDVDTKKSEKIVTVGSKEFYLHHVVAGETFYGLCKTYGVTEQDLVTANPVLKEGLKAGMVIGIPKVDVPVLPEIPQEEQTEPQSSTEVAQNEQPVVVPTEESKVVPTIEPEIIPEEKLEPPVVIPVVRPITDSIVERGDGYIILTIERTEKTRSLLRRWGVSEEDFRRMNPSVGSRVYEGYKVMMPVSGVVEEEEQPVAEPQGGNVMVADENLPEGDTIIVEVPPQEGPVYPQEMPYECYPSVRHADQLYRVALLVPLYLNDIDKLETSREKIEKTKNSRTLKFLQFYEGFMMAVDSLTEHSGLRLELTVIDVNENVAGAQAAVDRLRNKELDLIVGPFFSKSFAVVQEYALSHQILIVNPLSERESILRDAPNLVKLKPGQKAMADELADLIRERYPKAKVTLMTEGNERDSVMVDYLENALATVVSPEVQITNEEMLELIKQESIRRKMGKKRLSTLEVEGQIFSTKSLEENPLGSAYFENHFQRLTFSESEVNKFKDGLSSARDNVLVAYGSDIVFATKVLNNINKSAQAYPITLIGLPQWSDYDQLLVDNLLNMNAIYFDDHFVDFNDSVILKFVDDFRAKYECDAFEYAFEGFDVGWYVLNALMRFGSHPADCLPYYHLSLLHSRYYFNKDRREDGLENRFWNVYQYDNEAIELKPIMIYPEE